MTSAGLAAAAVVVVAAIAVAGCASNSSLHDSPGGSGPPTTCGTSVTVSQTGQPAPLAGPGASMRVTAQLSGADGVLGYAWTVQHASAAADFTRVGDGAAIDVPVPVPGVYLVTLVVSGASSPCPPAVATINVGVPRALTARYRVRVVPPRSVSAPEMEQLFDIAGGADADLGPIRIDPGSAAQLMVTGPDGPLPAYLQFVPDAMPDAAVEVFAADSGIAAVQLLPVRYSVLVVPSVAGLAPRRFAPWSPSTPLQLDAGAAVTGHVLGPTSAPVAGATVQLMSDGVPSTLATTVADGSFALHGAPGTSVTVEVVPPAGSGLPRLSATSTRFDLAASVEVHYAANVVPVDLAGMALRRGGVAAGGAQLTVMGTLGAVGTVTAGAASTAQVASGNVLGRATTDNGGVVPRLRVPAANLTAVVESAAGDFAVVGLDTAAPPSVVDTPVPQLVTTAMLDGPGAGLAGAVLDLVPTGPLATAGAPTVRAVAGADGLIAVSLPSGGRYELRFTDPVRRAGALVVAERPITMIAASYRLPAALQISGALRLSGTLALAGASVQLMCESCGGLDRALPLFEAMSDADGRFTLGVPDPGTR